MNVDENVFFREATLQICSSLNIGEALRSCFDYVKRYIPMNRMYFHTYDAGLNLLRLAAAARDDMMEEPERILYLPENGRNARAAELTADLLKIDMRHEHARLLKLLHRPFAIAKASAIEHQEVIRLKDMLADDIRYLFAELRSASGDEIIGSDFGLKAVTEMVQQVAALDSPVLLRGETGAGKEVIAYAIHYSSPRKHGPFIKVNCGAIPETPLDSELFGHEKGAFTGAIVQKRGRFERADKGTIFLDEIGELPPQAQVRLLHVLQSKEIERVGAVKSIPVDVRILSATHRNLEEMIKLGQFREDLLFRINVFPIMIPPLRQRREDIPALVHYFIEKKTKELKFGITPKLGPGAIDQLMDYHWPGNVRELENIVERALIRHRDGFLTFENVVSAPAKKVELSTMTDQTQGIAKLDEINAWHIERVLKLTKGKIHAPGGAAELLGIHPNTLRKRMDKLGISYRRHR